MKDQEEKKVALADSNAPSKPYKKEVEISEESKQERLLLTGLLLERTEKEKDDALLRKKKRDEELVELHSGYKFSIRELNAEITAMLQPYTPRFPNSIPFFSEIYRLNGWKHLDPNNYVKPPVVAVWINELIYDRFTKDVLPALRVLNPRTSSGSRLHKHFQFLTEEGQVKLDQYRDEAISLMKTCSTWYEFRQKLFVNHGVPYQISLFEK